jgi:hypothetical protein
MMERACHGAALQRACVCYLIITNGVYERGQLEQAREHHVAAPAAKATVCSRQQSLGCAFARRNGLNF